MVESQLTLTAEERDFLLKLLEAMEKEALVEEHRTRALDYREHILHREVLITGLLEKLRTSR
jgi:hypothetical protein